MRGSFAYFLFMLNFLLVGRAPKMEKNFQSNKER